MADITKYRSSYPTLQDWFDRMFAGWPTYSETEFVWSPRVDVHETDREIYLYVELPGVKREDVKVEIKRSVLTISGERKQEAHAEKSEFSRTERYYGKFERSFTLPETVKNDSIGANLRDGILTVTLQKTEKAIPKQIEVEVK
jgi:HSP20 family protein